LTRSVLSGARTRARRIGILVGTGAAPSAGGRTEREGPDVCATRVSSSELSSAGVENRCPVCQARFRGARICSRCGADLEPLMLLAVQAWQLRQAARQALDAGDVERALGLATEAQGIQDTGSGEALRLLGAWLKTL
jgi:DNA-directed RNA polymerase subunit RPC12/RpoP